MYTKRSCIWLPTYTKVFKMGWVGSKYNLRVFRPTRHCRMRDDCRWFFLATRVLYTTGSGFLSSFRICNWLILFPSRHYYNLKKKLKYLVTLHESCHFIPVKWHFSTPFFKTKIATLSRCLLVVAWTGRAGPLLPLFTMHEGDICVCTSLPATSSKTLFCFGHKQKKRATSKMFYEQ